jgi:hypothetical protein
MHFLVIISTLVFSHFPQLPSRKKSEELLVYRQVLYSTVEFPQERLNYAHMKYFVDFWFSCALTPVKWDTESSSVLKHGGMEVA